MNEQSCRLLFSSICCHSVRLVGPVALIHLIPFSRWLLQSLLDRETVFGRRAMLLISVPLASAPLLSLVSRLIPAPTLSSLGLSVQVPCSPVALQSLAACLRVFELRE